MRLSASQTLLLGQAAEHGRIVREAAEVLECAQNPALLPHRARELADRLLELGRRADYYRAVIKEQQAVMLRHRLHVDVSKRVLEEQSLERAALERQGARIAQLERENAELRAQGERLAEENRRLRRDLLGGLEPRGPAAGKADSSKVMETLRKQFVAQSAIKVFPRPRTQPRRLEEPVIEVLRRDASTQSIRAEPEELEIGMMSLSTRVLAPKPPEAAAAEEAPAVEPPKTATQAPEGPKTAPEPPRPEPPKPPSHDAELARSRLESLLESRVRFDQGKEERINAYVARLRSGAE